MQLRRPALPERRPPLRPALRVLPVVAAVGMDLLFWHGVRELRGGELLPLVVVPALVIAIHATLPARWSRPGTVHVVECGFGTLMGVAVPGFYPFAGILVSLHAVARRSPRGRALAGLAGVAVPFGLYSWNVASNAPDTFIPALLTGAAVWTAIAGTTWGLGRRTRVVEQRGETIASAHAAATEEVVRAERMRLARELHDSVAHAVSGMLLQAAGARALVKDADPRLRDALGAIEEAGVQAMEELHRMLGLLRSAAPDAAGSAVKLTSEPTARLSEIGRLVDSARAAGTAVRVTIDGTPGDLDPSVDLAAYRVVQESLTNVVKHGGEGARVRVHVVWVGRTVTLEVRNPLPSASTARRLESMSGGYGLVGLRERVTLVGGRLAAGPEDGDWVVRAELPASAAGAGRAP